MKVICENCGHFEDGCDYCHFFSLPTHPESTCDEFEEKEDE
jgi:hypothetical protein